MPGKKKRAGVYAEYSFLSYHINLLLAILDLPSRFQLSIVNLRIRKSSNFPLWIKL